MSATEKVAVEVCVDSVESALVAERGGAQRVELCAALLEGGITPSAGTIEIARRNLSIGLNVMIRPRGGDFCYSDLELQLMAQDIGVAKRLGADGVVLGILNEDGGVDLERTRRLMEEARPLSVTFHRAFDMTRDPYQSLEDLVQLKVDRVLTSGQETSALEGIELLEELVRIAGDRIILLPGGGIHERNIEKILRQTRAREIHVAAMSTLDGPMKFRNGRCFMGGELRPPEFMRTTTDLERVEELVRLGRL